MSLQEQIDEELRKVEALEKRKQLIKDIDVSEALVQNLQRMDKIEQSFKTIQEANTQIQTNSTMVNKKLDDVLTLLRQYVQDNRQAVDSINKYLKDWL